MPGTSTLQGTTRPHDRRRRAWRARASAALVLSIILIGGTAATASAEHLPVDSDPDIIGPEIASFSISPTAVDVRVTGATVDGTAQLTDDKSGVSDVRIDYRSPSGSQGVTFRFHSSQRVSGTLHVGTYETSTFLDTFREAGTWTVAGASTEDVVGNTRSYTAAQAVAFGAVPFTVQSTPSADTIAPAITTVRVISSPLDVSASDGFPTFEWDATDTGGSGVFYVNIVLLSPSSRQRVLAQAVAPGSVGQDAMTLSAQGLTSTSTPAGNFFETGLSRYSEPGVWTIQSVQVIDRANNRRDYTGATLPAILSGNPFFTVVSDPTDSAAPAVTEFRFSPSSIDVSTAPATVTVEFDVTDDLSGVQAAYLTFRSPTISAASPPSISRSATFYRALSTPRILSGTVEATVTFPTYDRGGDWTITQVCVVDRVKRLSCYSGATLGPLGPTSITVIANEAPVATVTGVTDGATYATAPTPTCDVRDREDGIVSGVAPVTTGPVGGVFTVKCSYTDTGGKSDTHIVTYTIDGPDPDPDSDGDGVPDATDNCPATANAGQADLDADGIGDACDDDIDGDGLSNEIEIWLGCDPRDRDTDDDGLWDGVEVVVGTNPILTDTDDDGEGDGAWLLRTVRLACGCSVDLDDDTNGNGVFDIVEHFFFGGLYDPALHGGGGYGSLIEYLWSLCGCAPDDPDGNGIPQTVEYVWGRGGLLTYIIRCGCTPWDDTGGGGGLRTEFLGLIGGTLDDDPDGDGVLTVIELIIGCDPNDSDTDGDGLSDGDELFRYGTNPLLSDTDGDGMNDGREIEIGCDPNDPDTDGDGKPDGTDPAPLGFISACGPAVDQPVVPLGTAVAATATVGGTVTSASLSWDDGTAPDTRTSAGSITATHLYEAAGVYTLTCRISDGTGGTDSEEYRYVVVYDPSGGFVTGGGWINSPAGAYPADPTLTGKATFGFVSKYLKGASLPTGSTEFQFKAGDLNFHSSSYQWLVVAGAKAQYKGIGTINGASGFGFLLTAIDGQLNGGGGVDKFRIKIWTTSTGEIVYDNQSGSGDDAAPTTAIAGGSIVIHRAK